VFSISYSPIRRRKLHQILTRFSVFFSEKENDERDENAMLESDLSGDFSAVWLNWMNSHCARKICHSGRWKLNTELHLWVLDTLYYDENILRCFISVWGPLRDFQLSLSFRHSALWLKHPALFYLNTRGIAWLPRSLAFITFKSSSKPFYFLSAIKFPIMKVNRWSTWSTFSFLTERFVTIDKTTKTEFVQFSDRDFFTFSDSNFWQ